jgi:hypothetical protein
MTAVAGSEIRFHTRPLMRALGDAGNAKGRIERPCGRLKFAMRSALAGLEARIALADHENLAATAHDLAVAVPLLRGFEGRKHFHGKPRGVGLNTESAEF